MKFGRYEVERTLGRGGMATVYLARDEQVGRLVAVKVLSPALAAESGFRERFRREARVIAALEHHAIVPLYDHGEDDGQPFLVFRFMDGGTLADRLVGGPMPLAEAAAIVKRVAEALDYARANGVVHRDLKPANILFDRHGDAFLGDFGIARLLGPGVTTTTSVSIGTPSYMSPEQAEGHPATPASDIYSLGCTVFEMLAGRPPFQANSVPALLLKHVRDEPPGLPASVPSVVVSTLRMALAKDPAHRPSRARAIAEAMSTAVSLGERPTRIEPGAVPAVAVPRPVPPRTPAASGQRAVARRRDDARFGLTPARPVPGPAPAPPAARGRRRRVVIRFAVATIAFVSGWAVVAVNLASGSLSWPELGILWLLCAPVCGAIAAVRRASAGAGAWTFVGLVLGPVAVWLLTALPVSKPSPRPASGL